MKTVWKLIFYGSLTFILLCILTTMLLMMTSLHFKDNETFDSILKIYGLGLPTAILLTLSRLGFTNNTNNAKIISRLTITILIAIFIGGGTLFYSFSAGICDWTTTQELYQHNTISSTKIVVREFGCGATDGSIETHQTFEIKELAVLFKHITEVDTNEIDLRHWVRIKN